jgi:hypothetical protein
MGAAESGGGSCEMSMASNDAGPIHRVRVDGFWMDAVDRAMMRLDNRGIVASEESPRSLRGARRRTHGASPESSRLAARFVKLARLGFVADAA